MQYKVKTRLVSIIVLLTISTFWIFASLWGRDLTIDATKLEDKYTHSQWYIPQSPRKISDSELYSYIAVAVAAGTPISQISPEVPALGKYLYAATYLLTNQPLLLNAGFYILAVFGFFCLASLLLKNQKQVLFAGLIFASTKLVLAQLSQVMLDLMLVTWLIWYVVFFVKFIQRKKMYFLIAAGLFLGLFSATKFPLFTLPIFVVSLASFWQSKQHNLRTMLVRGSVFISSVALGYLLSFTPYLLNSGVISWLSLQKWMVNFYLTGSSGLSSIYGLAIITSLTSLYTGWWNAGITLMTEWSPILLVGLVSTLFFLSSILKKNRVDNSWLYIVAILTSLLLTQCIVPFWSRYLLILLPFFILVTMKVVAQTRTLIVILALEIFISAFSIYLINPNETLTTFAHSWNILATDDLYAQFSKRSKTALSFREFDQGVTQFITQAEIKRVNTTIKQIAPQAWWFKNHLSLPIEIEYQSSIGSYLQTAKLDLVRENREWRIDYTWDLILPNYDPSLNFRVESQTLGSPTTLAPHLLVIPDQLDSWKQGLDLLSELGVKDLGKLFALSPGKRTVDMGEVQTLLVPQVIDTVGNYRGLRLVCDESPYILQNNLPEGEKQLFDLSPMFLEKRPGLLRYDKKIIIDSLVNLDQIISSKPAGVMEISKELSQTWTGDCFATKSASLTPHLICGSLNQQFCMK